MNVEFRLYKKFDADLIALVDAGYSVSRMMKAALIAYANGQPLHFYIDGPALDLDMNVAKTVHQRFVIPDSDEKTCYMIKNIKFRCRNMFFKSVLRNALIQQSLACFFADINLAQLQNENMATKPFQAYTNLVPCSVFKADAKQITFAGQTVNVDAGSKKPRVQKNRQTILSPFTAPQGNPMPQMPYYGGYPQAYPYPMPAQIQPQPAMSAPVAPVQSQPVANVEPIPITEPIPTPVPQPVAPSVIPTPDKTVKEATTEPIKEEIVEQTADDNVEIGLAGNAELMKMFNNL